MTRRYTCPSCQCSLLIADETPDEALTCPRCLNPMVLRTGHTTQTTVASLHRILSWLDTFLVVLAVLCLFGIFLIVLQPRGIRGLEAAGLPIIMALTAFLALIAVTWIGSRIIRWLSTNQLTLGRSLLGLALFLALSAAIVIVFFFSCLVVVGI